jgi:hypothetical protein
MNNAVFWDVMSCRSFRFFSETSVHTKSTRRHSPEYGILHIHRSENLKSYKVRKLFNFEVFTAIFGKASLDTPYEFLFTAIINID